MKQKVKRLLASIMVVLMLVTAVPLSGLSDMMASAAEAGTLPSNAIVLMNDEFYTKYWTNSNCELNCYNKITVPSRGYITLTLEKPYDDEGELCSYTLFLVDTNGNKVWICDTEPQKDSFSEYYVYKVGLNKGTYYLNVDPNFYVYRDSAPIPAKYKYNFTVNNYWEIEPNNTQSTATVLALNKMYSGVYADESYDSTYVDYYKVNLKKGGKYVLHIDNYEELDAGTCIVHIVNPSGEEMSLYSPRIKGTTALFGIEAASTGTYYIKLYNDGNSAGTAYRIGISCLVTPTSISNCSFTVKPATYTGKAITPTLTVKNGKTILKAGTHYTVSYKNNTKVGKATVTIKGIEKNGYNGTKTLTFNILPGVTKSLKATQSTSSIKLTWSKVAGATGYRVYRHDGKKWVKLADTKNTTYTVSKLKAGTNYKYAVKAYTTVGKTVYWSASFAQISTATKPATPAIKVTAGKKQAAVSWNKVTGVTGYVVYYSTSKNGEFKKLATVKGTSHTAKKLTTGKTYYFKVAAYKTVGKTNIYSAQSSAKNVKIK